jgi:hypothetical protein
MKETKETKEERNDFVGEHRYECFGLSEHKHVWYNAFMFTCVCVCVFVICYMGVYTCMYT